MSGKFGFVGFLLGGASFAGMLVVTAYSEWSKNSQESSEQFLRGQYSYQGLWWRCVSQRVGYFQCDNYDVSILGLDSDIQACRALMCIACIFSFFAVIIALLGLDCTTMVEPGSKAKARVSLVAGILFIIAGVACGGAVSWFAWKVTMEFYNPLYQNREFVYEYGACLYAGWVSMAVGACTLTTTIWFAIQVTQDYYDPLKASNSFKYEFGSCLYVGWICGGLTIIAGLLLTCGACGNLRSEPEDAYPSYSYKPQTTSSKGNDIGKAKTEYV